MTWPLARTIDTAVIDPSDPYVNAWVLDWDYYATFVSLRPLFDANAFFPARASLALSEYVLGEAMLIAPARIAGHPRFRRTPTSRWSSLTAEDQQAVSPAGNSRGSTDGDCDRDQQCSHGRDDARPHQTRSLVLEAKHAVACRNEDTNKQTVDGHKRQ